MGGGGGDEPDEALTMTTPRKGWWKKGIALLIFYGALLSALSNDGLVPREVPAAAVAVRIDPDAGLANATNATGLARVLDGGGATDDGGRACAASDAGDTASLSEASSDSDSSVGVDVAAAMGAAAAAWPWRC